MRTGARFTSQLSVALALALAGLPGAAEHLSATAPPPAGQTAQPGSAARAALAKARAALQAGRAAEALVLAEQVLAGRPADEEAIGIKVDALIGTGARDKALDAYDAWVQHSRNENLGVLARLARADLHAVAAQEGTPQQMPALGALAAAGDAEARRSLEKLAWATPPTTRAWPAVVVLGTAGDSKAIARTIRAVKESSGGGKVEALRALASMKTADADAVLREALATRDGVIQAAAAETIAALERSSLAPELRQVVEKGEPTARFAAAIALGRLQQDGGESLVEAGLTSRASDARLQAAAALRARGVRTWPNHVRPLLDDMDGLVRFQAAEMLLEVDRGRPEEILIGGTTDPNVAVRAEVARILAADRATDVAHLRRLLRDGAPHVRVQVARAILERAARGHRA